MIKYLKQILKNQIVIMGMLQDMQDELEYIPNIKETHKLLTEAEEKLKEMEGKDAGSI